MAKRIRGVILDVDGTLIDSNDQHARAWVEALARVGIDVPYEKVRRMIGMGGDKVLPALSGIEEGTKEYEQISEDRTEQFEKTYLPELRAFPKSRDLLVRMREEGLRLVVASSAKGEELDKFLEIAGAKDLIEEATSSSDAENSKPDPDIVQAALDELGLGADEVLMLGDTPYDVEAAARAGIRTVAVRCGGWEDDRLEGAIAVYDDPADLLARFDSSPFVARGRGRR